MNYSVNSVDDGAGEIAKSHSACTTKNLVGNFSVNAQVPMRNFFASNGGLKTGCMKRVPVVPVVPGKKECLYLQLSKECLPRKKECLPKQKKDVTRNFR